MEYIALHKTHTVLNVKITEVVLPTHSYNLLPLLKSSPSPEGFFLFFIVLIRRPIKMVK